MHTAMAPSRSSSLTSYLPSPRLPLLVLLFVVARSSSQDGECAGRERGLASASRGFPLPLSAWSAAESRCSSWFDRVPDVTRSSCRRLCLVYGACNGETRPRVHSLEEAVAVGLLGPRRIAGGCVDTAHRLVAIAPVTFSRHAVSLVEPS